MDGVRQSMTHDGNGWHMLGSRVNSSREDEIHLLEMPRFTNKRPPNGVGNGQPAKDCVNNPSVF